MAEDSMNLVAPVFYEPCGFNYNTGAVNTRRIVNKNIENSNSTSKPTEIYNGFVNFKADYIGVKKEGRQRRLCIFMDFMMKILPISIFLFISPIVFSSTQNETVVDDILGKYVLVDIATAITNDTALTELEEWIYKFGFNTICIDKNIIVFGSYTTIDPILTLLNKEEEYSVKLPNLNKIYTCSDFLGYFPEIKRGYNVVIYINTPLFWVIEPLDKYHIAININNMFLLYQKLMD